MEFFENRYFRTSSLSLLLIGQWPYENSKLQSFLRFFIFLCGVSLVIVPVCKFFTTKFSLNLFLEVLFPLAVCFLCYTKYFTCWWNVDIMKNLLNKIKEDWETLVVEEEIRILETYAEQGRILGMLYLVFIVAGLCLFILMHFAPAILDMIYPLNESRPHPYPFPAEYFVDQERYYYPILMHMLLVTIVSLGIATATDLMFILILVHSCGLFSVLGYRLEHAFDDVIGDTRKIYGGDKNCTLQQRLSNCVEYHIKSIKFVKTINSCYSISSIIQLVLTILTLTSILLRLFENLTVLKDYGQIVLCIVHASGLVFMAFLNIFPAQKLLDCSSNIFYSVYNARWYIAPLKIRRVLPLIMTRCMKPCGLTCAEVATSSLAVFATILQTSISYFTVLYSVRQ